MAQKRPSLPAFTATDPLAGVESVCSSHSEPFIRADDVQTRRGCSSSPNSPNGDKVETSQESKASSGASDLIGANDVSCNQEMAALAVNEAPTITSSIHTDQRRSSSGSDASSWRPVTGRTSAGDSPSKLPTSTRSLPDHHLLRCSNNQGIKTSRSPVRSSGVRPYSLVEERAKRFNQKPAGGEPKLINNGAMTIPIAACKRPTVHSTGYGTATVSSTAGTRHAELDRQKPVVCQAETMETFSRQLSAESKTTKRQAPPPAEIYSLPSVPISTVDILPVTFEEQTMMFEQSVRVEPSPERTLVPPECQEEEIQTTTTNVVEASLRMPDPNVQLSTAVRTGNVPRKVREFFGDPILVSEDFNCTAVVDPSVDGTEISKREPISRTEAKPSSDPSKGKKPWALTTKPQFSHPVSPRPRKPNERETSSSPKQKEHKSSATPTAPSAATGVIPSPPQPTWKERVVNPFKRHGSGSALAVMDPASSPGAAVVTGVIGVQLCLCQPGANENVPLIVELCTKIVEEKGLENQGIYRVPGNTGALNSLIDELNKDPITLCQDNDKWQDVNVVSSLLKLFFRKLPDSLITDDLYSSAISANHTENSERRMLKLKKILHDLPERNFETFRFLAQHLARIASREEVNKMDARNLAIMFGPSLVRPVDDNMVSMVRDMSDQCRIVESIIQHSDWFFSSWDEDVNVPVDEDADDSTPISGSNQIMLAKAESLANSTIPDVHAKILHSIINAANRKKHKDKGRTSSGQSSSDADSAFNAKSKLSSNTSKSKMKDVPSNKSNENFVDVADSTVGSVNATGDLSPPIAEDVEIPIKRYGKYDIELSSTYHVSVENSVPRPMRRAKSNDCLLATNTIRVKTSAGHDANSPVSGGVTWSPPIDIGISEPAPHNYPYGSNSVVNSYSQPANICPSESAPMYPYGSNSADGRHANSHPQPVFYSGGGSATSRGYSPRPSASSTSSSYDDSVH